MAFHSFFQVALGLFSASPDPIFGHWELDVIFEVLRDRFMATDGNISPAGKKPLSFKWRSAILATGN